MLKHVAKYLIVTLALLLGAQFVQPERSNPPTDPSAGFESVANASKKTAEAVGRACLDCHSNQTVWPWYSHVAPVSWLLANDVKEGRSKLNFSQWNIYSPEMSRIKFGQICREAMKAEMPPWYYVPLHPDAKLKSLDVIALCTWSR
jgi:hypothetical protein